MTPSRARVSVKLSCSPSYPPQEDHKHYPPSQWRDMTLLAEARVRYARVSHHSGCALESRGSRVVPRLRGGCGSTQPGPPGAPGPRSSAPPRHRGPPASRGPKSQSFLRFFAHSGAKSWGSGGAPPTNLILLRNQRPARPRRRAPPGPTRPRPHPAPPSPTRAPWLGWGGLGGWGGLLRRGWDLREARGLLF